MKTKSRLALVVITSCLALLALVVFQLKDTPIGPVKASPDITRAYLMWIKESNVRRWDKDVVNVMYFGDPTETDLVSLRESIAEIEQVPGVPDIQISTTDTDITVTFSPRERWPQSTAKPDHETNVKEAGLTVSKWGTDGRMRSAKVYIDANLSPTQRRRTIAHELLHALGAGHHDCRGGLMYAGVDRNPDWRIPDFDRTLLSLSYSKSLPPGTSADEFSEHVVSEPGIECPELLLESVSSPLGELWCSISSRSRGCVTADASATPSVSSPTVWLRDGDLYRYDPEKYTAFDTPDGRILCILPPRDSQSEWMPCERTDSSYVSNPSLWTDGTLVSQVNPEAT